MQSKLMKIDQNNDGSSIWRVACECTSPDHDVHMWFEPDTETDTVSLNLSMEIGFYYKGVSSDSFKDRVLDQLYDFKRRLKHAARVLFTGYARLEGDVILNQDGIEAMKTAIDKSLEHFESIKKNRLKN